MEFQLEHIEPITAPTTDVAKPLPLEVQIAQWSAEETELRALAATAEGITVAGHTDGPKAGRDVVHATLMPIWRRRCAIDNREKELLEIPKSLTLQIKGKAASLRAILSPVETALAADRDAYDAEQERIKATAKAEVERLAQVERDRLAAVLQARVDEITDLGGKPSLGWLATCTDQAYADTVADLTIQRDDRVKREAEELAERIRLEEIAAEERRIAEERRANEEAAALLARQVAQAREDSERRARQAQEDAAAEVARVARQKQQDADAAAARAERDRLAVVAAVDPRDARIAELEAKIQALREFINNEADALEESMFSADAERFREKLEELK